MLVIRVDGNGNIGSGHVMRCSAVAAEAMADGCDVVFAVSDEDSCALVESGGFRCEVLGGNYERFGIGDADLLADMATSYGASSVLVDSYAVCDSFFKKLASRGMECCYIDDAYTYDRGFDELPAKWDVAAVVNYGFGFSALDYKAVYQGCATSLHIKPGYAPVRDGFRGLAYVVRDEVCNVLVTSGMTNPDQALERMAAGCRKALPDAHIVVVVGGAADFDGSCLAGTDFEAIENAWNMPDLMMAGDLAVSAAGMTLYELACVGVPMIAAPIVENQAGNAKGIAKLGLGISFGSARWTADDICSSVKDLASSGNARREMSARSRNMVDGWGARRIYEIVKPAATRC